MSTIRLGLDTARDYLHAPFIGISQLVPLQSGGDLQLVYPGPDETPRSLLTEGKVDLAVMSLAEVFMAHADGDPLWGVGRISAGFSGLVVDSRVSEPSVCSTVGLSFGVRRWVDRRLLRALIQDIWLSQFCTGPEADVKMVPADGDITARFLDGHLDSVCLLDANLVLSGLSFLGRTVHAWGPNGCRVVPLGDRVLAFRRLPDGTLPNDLGSKVSDVHQALRALAELARVQPSRLHNAWYAEVGGATLQPFQRAMLDSVVSSIPWDATISLSYLQSIADWLRFRGLPSPSANALPWIDPYSEVLRAVPSGEAI